MKTITMENLRLLRDFAEAYQSLEIDFDASAIRLAETAISLDVDYCVELQSFRDAQKMLRDGLNPMADEDRPLVERLRLNAASRFVRLLTLLPPMNPTKDDQ